MTELFEGIGADRASSTPSGIWARRAVITILALIALLALLDVFGQGTVDAVNTTPDATLKLSAPKAVRGGLFFQSRIDIRVHRDVKYPRLVLDDGWVEGMQVNSIEPNPESESSRNGRLVLSYGELSAGDVLRVWLQFEVDPTSFGHRSYDLELDDESTPIARVSRKLTVFP